MLDLETDSNSFQGVVAIDSSGCGANLPPPCSLLVVGCWLVVVAVGAMAVVVVVTATAASAVLATLESSQCGTPNSTHDRTSLFFVCALARSLAARGAALWCGTPTRATR